PRKAEAEEKLEEVRGAGALIRDARYFDNLDTLTQTSTEKQIAGLDRARYALEELRDAGRISAEVFEARWSEALDGVLQEVAPVGEYLGKLKPQVEEIPEYAMRAADRVRWIFEDALFDPLHISIKGIGRDLVDTLRASIAEGMADKLFSSKSSGG